MRSCFSTLRYLLSGAILVASALTLAQSADTSSPLAAAARDTKAQKAAHAKKVITDEDMEISSGPYRV